MKAKEIAFGHAWKMAVSRIVWPHDKQSRGEWKRVIEQTRSAWESCYCDLGEPLAVAHLINALDPEVDLHDDNLLLAAA